MNTSQEIKIISQIEYENFQHPIWQMQIEGDCTNWILLLLILEKVIENKLQLDTDILIEQDISLGVTQPYGLELGKSYSILSLLQYMVFTQKNNINKILGCYVFGGWDQVQQEIRRKAALFGLHINEGDNSIQNKIQNFYAVAQAIFMMPIELIKKVFVKKLSLNGQKISPMSLLITCHQLDAVLYLTYLNRHYIFSFRHENQSIGIFHLLDQIHRIDYLVPYYHYFQQGLLAANKIQAKSDWINIIGDTYFGEFYSSLRKKKGIADALQRFGYSHSFEQIKQFFHENDVNIANFEAVFNIEEQSVLDDKKAFILGAQAKETLAEFERIHINTLCLANNHLKDYGAASLKHTLQQLEQVKIKFIGAGVDQQQAHQYLEIKHPLHTVAIFNGYWHRETAYQDYDFYALGNSSGVACINAILFEQIIQYKQNYPNHKVIVICHWGVDFKSIHPEQEKLANLLTQIGVDLVVGHGSHTIQPIKYVNHKPVIFGIGNGVFNSNGEFEKYQALPYGLIVQVDLAKSCVKLYPIFTNNFKTFWQPYPVDEVQFEQAKEHLTSQLNLNELQAGYDHLGLYIELQF